VEVAQESGCRGNLLPGLTLEVASPIEDSTKLRMIWRQKMESGNSPEDYLKWRVMTLSQTEDRC